MILTRMLNNGIKAEPDIIEIKDKYIWTQYLFTCFYYIGLHDWFLRRICFETTAALYVNAALSNKIKSIVRKKLLQEDSTHMPLSIFREQCLLSNNKAFKNDWLPPSTLVIDKIPGREQDQAFSDLLFLHGCILSEKEEEIPGERALLSVPILLEHLKKALKMGTLGHSLIQELYRQLSSIESIPNQHQKATLDSAKDFLERGKCGDSIIDLSNNIT